MEKTIYKNIKRIYSKNVVCIYVPLKAEVDLDALNSLSSGGMTGLRSCRYYSENENHVFEYTASLTSMNVPDRFSDDEAVLFISSLYDAFRTMEEYRFSFDNFDTSEKSIIRTSDRYLFVYIPLIAKQKRADADAVTRELLKRFKHNHKLIKTCFKEVSRNGNALEILQRYAAKAYAIPDKEEMKYQGNISYGSEGETTILSQSSYDSEGETSILSQSSYGNEGETTVLSQPSYGNEGETTVLSQPSYDNEGETTILSQSSYDSEGETTILSQSSYDSEGETTVLAGAATQYFDREYISGMAQNTPVNGYTVQKDITGSMSALGDNSRGFLVSPNGGMCYEITADEIMVGTMVENGVNIKHNSTVSRKHAGVQFIGGRVLIRDNHSTNGTYVDGTELPPGGTAEAYNGSFVSFGNESFQIIIK